MIFRNRNVETSVRSATWVYCAMHKFHSTTVPYIFFPKSAPSTQFTSESRTCAPPLANRALAHRHWQISTCFSHSHWRIGCLAGKLHHHWQIGAYSSALVHTATGKSALMCPLFSAQPLVNQCLFRSFPHSHWRIGAYSSMSTLPLANRCLLLSIHTATGESALMCPLFSAQPLANWHLVRSFPHSHWRIGTYCSVSTQPLANRCYCVRSFLHSHWRIGA